MPDEKRIPRAEKPSEVGVSSKEVQNLINEWEKEKVNIHSVMILRHGKVACEAFKSPLQPTDSHMVYSVSKSFLSVAFGFAVDEGFISLDTKFIDIFPEYRDKKDKNLEKLTLLDLVAMRSGKRFSVLAKRIDNWIDYFVNGYWDFEPGTDWRYVSENFFVVSAALKRATGMGLNEFLTPRLYEPLGIDVPFWERSPDNIEAGGWGIQLKTEDIAKFILCCHNNGVYDGKQVIPAWYLEKATAYQSDNSRSQRKPDSQAGYGYGFWRCAGVKNAFRCEGLYSQYGISLKDYDACIVTTASTANLQLTLDVLWKYIDKIFIEENSSDNADNISIRISPSPEHGVKRNPEKEKQITGNTYKMRKKIFLNMINYPVSVLPMPAIYFSKDPGGNIQNIQFNFNENGLDFSWIEDGGFKNKIYVSMNGEHRRSKIVLGEMEFDVLATAKWLDEKTLEMIVRPLSTVASRRLVFTFNGDRITLYPDVIPPLSENAKTIGETIKCVLPGTYFKMWVDILVPKITMILQPKHHGKAGR